MTETDIHIIQQSKEGDRRAFRLIVSRHQQMVFSLALKMTCDEDDAKDIVQDTFIKVWMNLKDFDTGKKLSTWIYSIALHLCLDRVRSRKEFESMPEDESVLRQFTTDIDGHRELECREWISIVRIITEGLSKKQKTVFTLCQLEGLSSQEVEQITGFSASQVKSNLYAARQTVKERLSKLGYE